MRIEIGRHAYVGTEISRHNRLFWLLAALAAAGASLNTGPRWITTILIFLSAATATLAAATYTLLWQVFHREVEATAERDVVMGLVSWQALGLYAFAPPLVVAIALFGGIHDGHIQPWMGVVIVVVSWLLGAASGRFATSVVEPILSRGRRRRTLLWLVAAASLSAGVSFVVFSFDKAEHFALARKTLTWTYIVFIVFRLLLGLSKYRPSRRHGLTPRSEAMGDLIPAGFLTIGFMYLPQLFGVRPGSTPTLLPIPEIGLLSSVMLRVVGAALILFSIDLGTRSISTVSPAAWARSPVRRSSGALLGVLVLLTITNPSGVNQVVIECLFGLLALPFALSFVRVTDWRLTDDEREQIPMLSRWMRRRAGRIGEHWLRRHRRYTRVQRLGHWAARRDPSAAALFGVATIPANEPGRRVVRPSGRTNAVHRRNPGSRSRSANPRSRRS